MRVITYARNAQTSVKTIRYQIKKTGFTTLNFISIYISKLVTDKRRLLNEFRESFYQFQEKRQQAPNLRFKGGKTSNFRHFPQGACKCNSIPVYTSYIHLILKEIQDKMDSGYLEFYKFRNINILTSVQATLAYSL